MTPELGGVQRETCCCGIQRIRSAAFDTSGALQRRCRCYDDDLCCLYCRTRISQSSACSTSSSTVTVMVLCGIDRPAKFHSGCASRRAPHLESAPASELTLFTKAPSMDGRFLGFCDFLIRKTDQDGNTGLAVYDTKTGSTCSGFGAAATGGLRRPTTSSGIPSPPTYTWCWG